jgi:hypothetical protein
MNRLIARLAVGGVATAAVLLSAGAAVAAPVGSASPSSGLKMGQTISVTASGFTPGKSLGVTFCSDQGNATGAGDCDLGGIKPVKADAAGKVSASYTLPAAAFGANQRTCDATHKCLISVGEQTASATAERAVIPLSFGSSSTGGTGLPTTGAFTGLFGLAGAVALLLGITTLLGARRARLTSR